MLETEKTQSNSQVDDTVMRTVGSLPADNTAAIPSANSTSTLLSRRSFIASALGAGVAAATVTGDLLLTGCSSSKKEIEELSAKAVQDKDVPVVEVSEDQLVEGTTFEEAAFDDYLELADSFDLPVGSLAYQIDSELVLVLLPGSERNQLRQIALLDIVERAPTILVDRPIGTGRNTIIYDARASKTRLIWVELDLGTFNWHTYGATLADKTLGAPALLESGDVDYDPPMLAAYGDSIYWTVMPEASGQANQNDSLLRTIPPEQALESGQINPVTLITSHGRMITNPLTTEGIITVVPRVDTENIYYQLTALDCASGKTVAYQVLPQGVRVSDAVYMNGGFTFSLEANYIYAGGLSRFGIYQQLAQGSYLHISKPPTNAMVQIDSSLYVKSTNSIIAIDSEKRKLFIVRAPVLSSDYGEALIGWGKQEKLLTCSTRMKPGGKGAEAVMIRVFTKALPKPEEPEDSELSEDAEDIKDAEEANDNTGESTGADNDTGESTGADNDTGESVGT